MALLALKDIGKIYASEGSVAVGIRGVNLSFDRGEFVAVTGKSGSGKSTLLNVISGMDSYEEGELFIEGEPTSHFMQPEWEAYRQKYISFIFQDYNIIESFTVLQNVELALMHITDRRERRRRAMELIDRVGLRAHMKHKGSKLSGGQKQRTVIARALAKDSPIILADEPTGNLDSVTSREIIELLKEVSKDKLLIMVTHNFDEVEAYATRHIRIFDGAVESDHVLSASTANGERSTVPEAADDTRSSKTLIKNGMMLGRTVFTARPKLSVFLCLLMIVGAMGVFLVTTLCGEMVDLFESHYMFTPIDGRVVLTRQNGAVMSDDEVKALASEYGAADSLHYDMLLDRNRNLGGYLPELEGVRGANLYPRIEAVYKDTATGKVVGRKPTAEHEVLLRLPIGYQPYVGKDTLKISRITVCEITWTVVGVSYYYDNNQRAQMVMTEEGFRTLTAASYLDRMNVSIAATSPSGEVFKTEVKGWFPSFAVEAGKVYLTPETVSQYPSKEGWTYAASFSSAYTQYNYDEVKSYQFSRTVTGDDLVVTSNADVWNNDNRYWLAVSTDVLRDMAEEVFATTYRQASLFFASNGAARTAAERLCEAGYIAVTADTTYTPDPLETISDTLGALFTALVWVMGILFIGFFINLCSSRTVGAFRGDVAIMRSMGIPVKVIRVGMYVRMLIALVPAYLLVVIAAIVIFTSPVWNPYFVYLYAWQYAAIFVGLLILVWRVSRKQIHRLFHVSVKKALRGGDSA